MRILSALASGVSGAEGGSVEIYQRGTTTRATLYQDFEGKQPTLLSPVTLDPYGRAVIYVNEYVDIVPTGYAGETLTPWTDGDSGSGIEIISSKFQGTDYETAEAGLAKPVNLVSVLESLKDSVDTHTSDLSALSSPFYVVTDAEYGAVGNGTDDDSSAIQSAIDAAHADGGGVVFFPSGNYLCDSGLDTYADVTLLGASSSSAVLWAAADIEEPLVTVDMGSGGRAVLRSMMLDAMGSTGYPGISAVGGASSAKLMVDDCQIGPSRYFSAGVYASGIRANLVTLRDCTLYCGAARAVEIAYDSTAPLLQMIGGRVVCGSALSVDAVSMYGGIVCGVLFDNASMTSGTEANLYVGGGGTDASVLAGNVFSAPAGGTGSYAIESHNTKTVDSGNHVASSQLCSYQSAGTGEGGYTQSLESRLGRAYIEVHDTTAAAVADTGKYATLYYSSTTGEDFSLTLPACPVGCPLTLILQNQDDTESMSVAISGTHVSEPWSLGTSAGDVRVIHLRSMATGDGSGSPKWMMEDYNVYTA